MVAVVPARGGSKGVPGKNLEAVGGRPLISRAVAALRLATLVDEVVVTTDDEAITAAARAAGATVVHRPAELAGDTASSESAVRHALDVLAERDGTDPEVVVFAQCTSPFITPADVDGLAGLVLDGGYDTAFTATRVHEFLWSVGADGCAVGVNHDPAVRPRRQDRQPEYRETGALYAFRAAGFRRHAHRFHGRVGMFQVPAERAIEIDTAGDLAQARALAARLDRLSGAGQVGPVDAVVTDFDGVHTDDRALVLQDGTEGVLVSRADGAGVARLLTAGLRVLVLSVERNPVVKARAAKLGAEVLHGVTDKAGTLDAWLHEAGLDRQRVAYLGNDLADLPCMSAVGWPVAVADAHPQVLAAARVVLGRRGGHGAVRELADLVLTSEGRQR